MLSLLLRRRSKSWSMALSGKGEFFSLSIFYWTFLNSPFDLWLHLQHMLSECDMDDNDEYDYDGMEREIHSGEVPHAKVVAKYFWKIMCQKQVYNSKNCKLIHWIVTVLSFITSNWVSLYRQGDWDLNDKGGCYISCSRLSWYERVAIPGPSKEGSWNQLHSMYRRATNEHVLSLYNYSY